MWLLQRIQLRLKMLQDVFLLQLVSQLFLSLLGKNQFWGLVGQWYPSLNDIIVLLIIIVTRIKINGCSCSVCGKNVNH
jgi:hypothetical protein